MARQRGSKENATRKKPRHAFSLTTFGSRTQGRDKNAPPKDSPYLVFGKRMQRSLMSFGSIAAAIYCGELMPEAILNESHGISNPGKKNMKYFHKRLDYHRRELTVQFQTMSRAAEALLTKFPSIRRDLAQAGEHPQRLINKIREVMFGAQAARHTDVCNIRSDIFILSHDDAKKRGWTMPTTIEKGSRGIKSKETALFLLPFIEREKYLKDPDAYHEQVERGKIKISLTNAWPTILYDESMTDDNELSGLFRSETLLRCGIAVLHGPSAGRAWRYPEPGARSFAASRKEANAEINGITAISPEVIAYISTLAVFAVHDSDSYNRKIGGIDLSELYHDIIAALRMKTEWAVETLEFWNNIFFGDVEEEESEPEITREDRFKEIEAKQREREGLQPVGMNTSRPPASRTDHRQGDQNTSNDRSPTPAGKSLKASTIRSGSGQKRKSPEPGSESSSDSDSDSDVDPIGVVPVDSVDPMPKPLHKRIKKEHGSTDSDKGSHVPPQPTASTSKKQQATDVLPTQQQDDPTFPREIDAHEWEHSIRHLIEQLSEWAKAIDRMDRHAELMKILDLDPEMAAHICNMNHDRIQRWRKEIEEGYRMGIEEEDSIIIDNDALLLNHNTESPSTSKPRPKPTKKDPEPQKKPPPKKRKAVAQRSAEAMPPPRKVTRSITAQLSHQKKNDPIDNDEVLTDLDELPTNTKPVKGKSPVTPLGRH